MARGDGMRFWGGFSLAMREGMRSRVLLALWGAFALLQVITLALPDRFGSRAVMLSSFAERLTLAWTILSHVALAIPEVSTLARRSTHRTLASVVVDSPMHAGVILGRWGCVVAGALLLVALHPLEVGTLARWIDEHGEIPSRTALFAGTWTALRMSTLASALLAPWSVSAGALSARWLGPMITALIAWILTAAPWSTLDAAVGATASLCLVIGMRPLLLTRR